MTKKEKDGVALHGATTHSAQEQELGVVCRLVGQARGDMYRIYKKDVDRRYSPALY